MDTKVAKSKGTVKMDDDKYVYYNIKSENDVVTLTVKDLKKKTLM